MPAIFRVGLPGYIPPLTLALVVISGDPPAASYNLTHTNGVYEASLSLVGRYSLRINSATEVIAFGYVELIDGSICEPVGTLVELIPRSNNTEKIAAAVRSETDTNPIRFAFPLPSVALTITRSINGTLPYVPAIGGAAFIATEGGINWYSLAYEAADRAVGAVRYRVTDGTLIKFFNLTVLAGGGGNINTLLTEVQKIPRGASPVIGGADSVRTKVSASSTILIERIT